MDNIKNYVVIAVAVVAVVLGVVIFQKAPVVNNTIENPLSLGTVSGNEIQGNYITVGGVTKGYFSQGFNIVSKTVASTTLCQIKTGDATSTLMFASAQIASSTLATTFYEWGKSSSIQSTTTSFGTYTFASGIKGTMIASSSPSQSVIDPVTTFAPYSYLTLKTGSTAGRTGSCRAEFIVN